MIQIVHLKCYMNTYILNIDVDLRKDILEGTGMLGRLNVSTSRCKQTHTHIHTHIHTHTTHTHTQTHTHKHTHI